MKMLRMCLNPWVIAGLVAVAVGIYLYSPGLALAALPFLIFAACPLSMLVMMKMMMGMGTGGGMGNGASCHDEVEKSISKPDATPEASQARPLTDEQPESGATHREPGWRAL